MANQENKLSGSFISINNRDTKTEKSSINQMADFLESDILDNVRRYEVYEKPAESDSSIKLITSLYQTILDQPLENSAVANELFDITVGSYATYDSQNNVYTVNGQEVKIDNAGKAYVDDGSGSESTRHFNVRENIGIYRQFAQTLLGDANRQFTTKASVSDEDAAGDNTVKLIDEAIFLCFKRLFVNDNIAKGSFELNIFYETAEIKETAGSSAAATLSNIFNSNHKGTASIINDSSSQTFVSVSSGGEIGTLYKETTAVGVIYYDSGVVVLDASLVLNPDQLVKGLIDSVETATAQYVSEDGVDFDGGDGNKESATQGQLYYLGSLKDFWFRASIDDVIDHVRQRIRKTLAYSDVSSSINSAISFTSEMFINSSLIFCRAAPSQCNLSSNPSYTAEDGSIHASISTGSSSNAKKTFSYVTTVGLYDGSGDLLAVAKTSRPIEKNSETDLSIRVRIDY